MKAYGSKEFSMDIGTPDSYRKAQEVWHEMMHIDG
jgi:NDP-sugar pyrophosphorylase family protein